MFVALCRRTPHVATIYSGPLSLLLPPAVALQRVADTELRAPRVWADHVRCPVVAGPDLSNGIFSLNTALSMLDGAVSQPSMPFSYGPPSLGIVKLRAADISLPSS